MKRHHTFLFTLNKNTVIDGAASTGGGDASFINHSCDPNCEAVITGKKIFIHALRGIERGTELAYDYQYERTGKNDAELERFYLCKCGAANCRGSIIEAREEEEEADWTSRAHYLYSNVNSFRSIRMRLVHRALAFTFALATSAAAQTSAVPMQSKPLDPVNIDRSCLGVHRLLPVRQRWLDKDPSGAGRILALGQLRRAVREQPEQPPRDPPRRGRQR